MVESEGVTAKASVEIRAALKDYLWYLLRLTARTGVDPACRTAGSLWMSDGQRQSTWHRRDSVLSDALSGGLASAASARPSSSMRRSASM